VAVVASVDTREGDTVDVALDVPRDLLGGVACSLTPFLPVAAVAAAAAHDELEVDGTVSPMVLTGAQANVETMAGWWGWRPPRITVAGTAPSTRPEGARGTGLFFSRGVDSWASLLTLQAEGTPPTHLLTIRDVEQRRSPAVQAEVLATTRQFARRAGVELVELSTDARTLLDPLDEWPRTHGAVLAAFALLLEPMLEQVFVASTHGPVSECEWGSHPQLDGNWSSEALRITHHLAHLDRTDKIAVVAGSQLALDGLLVCWQGGDRNCGRCAKCLRTMTGLDLCGALDRCPTFDAPLSAEAVRYAPSPDSPPFVDELLSRLPPGEMRAAWERHLPGRPPGRRLVAPDTVAVAGHSLRHRVNAALATTDVRADPADEGPDLAVGWEPGMVALRPPSASHRAVRSLLAANGGRPTLWAVADLADEHQRNDPWPSTLANRALELWGPGLCYLAGIGWGRPREPVLGPAAVATMLRTARMRLWWSPGGTLDPLRVVESIEHGCLPLQVMLPGQAEPLRRRLPLPLARLVVDFDALAALDLTSIPRLLADAADVVLAGSAERDLVLAVTGGLVNR
jgi:hypothetical protein